MIYGKYLNRAVSCIVALAAIAILAPSAGSADTRYVSDQLIITLREGQGNEYKIIRSLKTGTPLEILEETEQHLRVRTQDGKEGWVLKRYITSERPKKDVIAELEGRIEALNKKIADVRSGGRSAEEKLGEERKEHKAREKDLIAGMEGKDSEIASLRKNLEELTTKYNYFLEQSKDTVSIIEERDALAAEKAGLETERDTLKRENDRLNERLVIYWFLAGAGVFFFGWISGKFSRKKKRYY